MDIATPHYLLFSQPNQTTGVGHWQFTLRSVDGSQQFEAADVEPGLQGERLELLTVIRALESLDQPSQVTLMGWSEYIRNGMQYGLPEWQANGWQWEFFGQMVPVKNYDLWQRMERTLRFHRVECCRRRFDAPHTQLSVPKTPAVPSQDTTGQDHEKQAAWGIRVVVSNWLKYRASVLLAGRRRLLAALRLGWQRLLGSLGTRMPNALDQASLQGGMRANHRCVREYSSTR
jgi:ribonuclease HI